MSTKTHRIDTEAAFAMAGHFVGHDILGGLVAISKGLTTADLTVLVDALPTSGERRDP